MSEGLPMGRVTMEASAAVYCAALIQEANNRSVIKDCVSDVWSEDQLNVVGSGRCFERQTG